MGELDPLSAHALALIESGYFQVSRTWRTVARAPLHPSGARRMNGYEAMETVPMPKWRLKQWLKQPERSVLDQFLRVYAKDTITLSPTLFDEFRRLGGGTAQ